MNRTGITISSCDGQWRAAKAKAEGFSVPGKGEDRCALAAHSEGYRILEDEKGFYGKCLAMMPSGQIVLVWRTDDHGPRACLVWDEHEPHVHPKGCEHQLILIPETDQDLIGLDTENKEEICEVCGTSFVQSEAVDSYYPPTQEKFPPVSGWEDKVAKAKSSAVIDGGKVDGSVPT